MFSGVSVCMFVCVSVCVCVCMCLCVHVPARLCVWGGGYFVYLCLCNVCARMCVGGGEGGLCIYTYARPSVFLGLVYAQVAIQSNI